MKKFGLDISGKIENIASAKVAIRIAAIATILFELIEFLDGNYGNVFIVPIVVIMVVFNSRIAVLTLLVWQCFVTLLTGVLTFVPMYANGNDVRLWLPFLSALVLLLLYRAVWATIFIDAKEVESEEKEADISID